jgi:hypothetical protein
LLIRVPPIGFRTARPKIVLDPQEIALKRHDYRLLHNGFGENDL